MIQVVARSATALPVDAVLRAADAALAPIGAASAELDREAGDRFTELRRVQAPLEVGAAVITGGAGLAAEFVLHVVIQDADRPASRDTIRRALLSAWHRAEGWQLAIVAAPLVGVGVAGLGAAEAAGLLIETFQERPRTTGFPAELHIAVPEPAELAVVQALVDKNR